MMIGSQLWVNRTATRGPGLMTHGKTRKLGRMQRRGPGRRITNLAAARFPAGLADAENLGVGVRRASLNSLSSLSQPCFVLRG